MANLDRMCHTKSHGYIHRITTARAIYAPHIDPCHHTPLHSNSSFFSIAPNCHYLINFFDLLVPTVPLASTIVVDLLAIFRLRKFVQLRRTMTSSRMVKLSRNRELRLCCMILVQAVISVYVYISLGFAAFIDNDFLEFLASTFTWGAVQAVDGIVVILFNTEMHTLRKNFPHPPRRISQDSFFSRW
uniref:7TM_GPCR_Srx domain-containing protein n=1 Tax=Steinernema glaseri TaxID=37863 RepID=A0A1I7YJX5_9BILA